MPSEDQYDRLDPVNPGHHPDSLAGQLDPEATMRVSYHGATPEIPKDLGLSMGLYEGAELSREEARRLQAALKHRRQLCDQDQEIVPAFWWVAVANACSEVARWLAPYRTKGASNG